VDPIRVLVKRAGITEAEHLVHAVAVRDGKTVTSAGSPRLVTFMRSSSKPVQALPFARAYEDAAPRELAIAAASHLANRAQLDAVRAVLSRGHSSADDLECGAAGAPPSRLKHNCSGKHAGMLAACRAHGWRTEGYRLSGHRMQRTNLQDVARLAGLDEDEIRTAVDGCGVVTFALPLDKMAFVFTQLQSTPEGSRIADAMRAHPELIRGPLGTDTLLMQNAPGAVAKGGAEGLMCGVLADGTGFALKSLDGNERPLRAALAAFLEPLGTALPDFVSTAVTNSRDEVVGEVVAA
jgi:L-asparaginase